MRLRSQKAANLVGNVRHALTDLMRLLKFPTAQLNVSFFIFEAAQQCQVEDAAGEDG